MVSLLQTDGDSEGPKETISIGVNVNARESIHAQLIIHVFSRSSQALLCKFRDRTACHIDVIVVDGDFVIVQMNDSHFQQILHDGRTIIRIV